MSANIEQRKLAAIMFTDMVGYSALAQRNEALALELLEEHRRVLRPIFPKHNGREVETAGDAFLVEFVSALEAVRCAVEIQEQLSERNRLSPPERGIRLRIGIHVGDVVHKEGKVMGDAVNIAARIEPLAAAGGICISSAVYEQVRNKLPQQMAALGSAELKNIELPMVVHRVVMSWEPQSSSRREGALDDRKATGKRFLSAPAKWALGAVLLLLAMGITWLFAYQKSNAPKKAATSPIATNLPSASDLKSVAVLPFVNMSADKNDEYLSDGMTEELLNALAKIKGLRVPGRSSSFAFKGKNEEGIFRKVGEQLNVQSVLEGSVRKSGNQLRITANLIDVAGGFQLWGDIYDYDMTNIFVLQSKIAASVAAALKVQLLGTISEQKKPTDNIEAYSLYLQGRQLWSRRTGDSVRQAVKYFEEAIAKDPNYALAYAGLADCYTTLPMYAGMRQQESVPKLRAAALKAMQLDNSLAEPHAALADVKANFDNDWAGSEAEFRQAIALNPNYSPARYWLVASVLRPLRRFDEALAEIQLAQGLDALSPIINLNAAETLSLVGQSEQAIQILQKLIAADPSFLQARTALGSAYYNAGKLPEALAELESMNRLDGTGAHRMDYLGFVLARSGRTGEAQKILDKLQALQRQGSDSRVAIALVQHGLGDDQSALASLEQAFEERASLLVTVNFHPLWKDLRLHPRTQAIMKRMNLVK